MKKYKTFLVLAVVLTAHLCAHSQQRKPDVFEKANNTVNRASNAIAVFQPYLLKSRELFYEGKQLVADVKNSAKNMSGNGSNGNGQDYNSGSSYSSNNSGAYQSANGSNTTSNTGYNSPDPNGSNNTYQSNQNASGYNGNPGYQTNYLPGQSLPINNPSSINNDGTGNWGNQNNGLYGNCLDVLTGTIMGMGDAAQAPKSVDLMFFAPTDGQNSYCIMTPGFARNNGTAGYMTQHVSEQVMQWSDVNESEVALTKLTLGQFNQIQNNSQIQSAVRNAQDYAGYYTSVGQKLDGQVFAVKMQMDDREIYALVAVIKHMGTSGSSGYLKIKIKSTGIDLNHDGQVDANAYQRSSQ
jgi:hypothetical protein